MTLHQTLMLDDVLLSGVLPGATGNTIRKDHRPIRTGPLTFLAATGAGTKAEVTVQSVRHTVASAITEEEIRINGSASLPEFVEEMQRFYPDFGLDTPVTVVAWKA